MYSISLNMKFWDDNQPNSTRIRNVNFTWDRLKKFTQFLNQKGVDAKCFLYDFSERKIIEDSIHIPYPDGVYKKAEKTNIILKQQKNYDFFLMIDCDAFFNEDDYENMFNIISELSLGDIITFDLAKLESNVDDYIIDGQFVVEKSNWSYAYSGKKENGPLNGYMGGLGGVYISDTKLLLELGGFDEKYVGWGGEDGEMLGRIMTSKNKHKVIPIRNFAPFHLPHFSDWGNKLYKQRFENE